MHFIHPHIAAALRLSVAKASRVRPAKLTVRSRILSLYMRRCDLLISTPHADIGILVYCLYRSWASCSCRIPLQLSRSKTPLQATLSGISGQRKAWPTTCQIILSLWFGNHRRLLLPNYISCRSPITGRDPPPPVVHNRCERASPIEGWQMFARNIHRPATHLLRRVAGLHCGDLR